MHPIVLILLMMGIGALIGGVTNSLAIKMLFRPYRAIYIGKFRVPFTPGLIPKRQNELARQLGKMVVNHLLTPEGIRRKLTEPAFVSQMTSWAEGEAERWLKQDKTVQSLLQDFQMDVSSEEMRTKTAVWIEQRYHKLMHEYRQQEIRELLTPEWTTKVDNGVDQAAEHIQKSIENYFRSTEGREKVSALIDHYMDNQGFLGSMISSFLGPDGLTERLYPILLKYVSDKEMSEWLKTMLHAEKDKWLDMPLESVEERIGSDEIGRMIGRTTAEALPFDQWLGRSVADWTAPIQDKVTKQWVPVLINKAVDVISDKVEGMIQSVRLAEVVQEEVEAFQVDRLEEMVLGISRREFKMITYLGALLGGLIGLLQAVLVMVIG
ncbi:DUF445 family protein [Halobacillus litoralis]|uniref:DUF445 family protein n=1 Tax=Halobacillus litoralis TaxID=45668 RepID=A0A845DLY4_9BACI|nr:DUF445 family protein [Halobacillus litoralis]MYL18363.1 DUF445 family protein [Halobacillus litoralis]MYL38647.1 DUF445 family protein [Halobacillus litoralis]